MSIDGSYSGDFDWRVARKCDNGACTKVARDGEYVLIGNTSSPRHPVSRFTTEEWRQFITGVKLGDFDGLA